MKIMRRKFLIIRGLRVKYFLAKNLGVALSRRALSSLRKNVVGGAKLAAKIPQGLKPASLLLHLRPD